MFDDPYVRNSWLAGIHSISALTVISHCKRYVSHENYLNSRPCSVALDLGQADAMEV